eukprot:gene25214-31645_t
MNVGSTSVSEDTSAPSAFSFMSSEPDKSEDTSSGFGFMSGNSDAVDDAPSSFSFLSNSEPPPPPQVVKKKRASRVGFAREDEGEDDASVATVNTVAHSVSSLSMISEDDHNEETEHHERKSDVSLHSVMEHHAEGATGGLSAFDFLSSSSSAIGAAPEPTSSGFGFVADSAKSGITVDTPVTSSKSEFSTPAASMRHTEQIIEEVQADSLFSGMSTTVSAPAVVVTPVAAAKLTPIEPQKVVKPVAVVVPVPVPVVAVAATPRVESVNKLTLINSLVAELTKLQNKSIAEHKQIRSDIDKATHASTDLRARLVGLEAEQNRLAQEEEFERAEALGVTIDAARADIEENTDHVNILKATANELSDSFLSEREALLKRIASVQSELITVKVALDEELAINNASGPHKKSRADELEESRLRAEQDRISLEKSHFEREESQLANELQVTEEAIRTQSGDYQTSRETVEMNLMSVQSEIKRLEQQLLAKREEEKGLLQDLTTVETKINEVRKKYERQLQRIHDRSAALQATKFECLAEERALDAEQEVFFGKMREASEAREALTRWTGAVENNLKALGLFVEGIKGNDELLASQQRSLLSLVSAISACDSSDTKHNTLVESLESCSIALSGAQNALEGLEAQMAALTTESRSISEQIPKLEVEKKTHATSKRFKEAAAVAKDIKDFQARREEIDAEVKSVGVAMDEQTLLVEVSREKHNLAVEELKEAHRQEDITRFEALLTMARQLRRNRVTIKRKDSDFVGEDLKPFLALYATMESLLEDELSAVLSEAELIKQKHSLTQSLEPEPEPEVVQVPEVVVEVVAEESPAAGIESNDQDADAVLDSLINSEVEAVAESQVDTSAEEEDAISTKNGSPAGEDLDDNLTPIGSAKSGFSFVTETVEDSVDEEVAIEEEEVVDNSAAEAAAQAALIAAEAEAAAAAEAELRRANIRKAQ